MLRNVLLVKLIKLYTVNFYISALYMLWNVLIVKLKKLYTVNYMYSLSALYMLQYVPIVTYSCKLLYFKKKKKQKTKKKKKKKTRISVWVKIPKLCYKKPRYLSFLLGKGGNPYVSKLYLKTK